MKSTIMIQGTGSDVGKSLLVAGLGRLFARQGIKVAPFKPQNMSNNAAVTEDGGEIGRAQALQARACFLAPNRHMNPVLLKPQSDIGAQIVVQGKMWGNAKPAEYRTLRHELMAKVMESYRMIQENADLVLIEGAGSPAEINLREGDIANMGFAIEADVPVILVGDIERGGVIASIVGTKVILPKEESQRIKGFIVNKFRGDPKLFDEGVQAIICQTEWPCLGVVPSLDIVRYLPAEDTMALARNIEPIDRPIRIAVPRLPRISNFDDLDPLRMEKDVAIFFVEPGNPLPADVDLILLPGSKATIADLKVFMAVGWDIDLRAHVRRGGRVLGLCGGYQMLGRRIDDKNGIEGAPESISGLGLLDIETRLEAKKSLRQVKGKDLTTQETIHGYEMHIGVTQGIDCMRPMLDLGGEKDGAISADGRVMGCYVHGIFASDQFRSAFLNRLRRCYPEPIHYEERIETILDTLADHLAVHLDIDRIKAIADRENQL